MSDDCISRQAAIDRAVSIPMFGRDVKMVAVSEIKNLPSAQPDSCDYWDNESHYCALHRPAAQPEERTDKHTETHGACLDAISRQAAIGEVKKHYRAYDNDLLELITFNIERLPPAQSEERAEKRTETHACDLISRIAVYDRVSRIVNVNHLDPEKVWFTPIGVKALIEELPPAQPEQRWIPCSERLPENRVSVIVCFREWQQYAKRYVYSIVVGWYARKHSVHENVFSDWEADCEYDEIEDEYYIEEGWYEFTTQGNGDLMNWYINADVIAWMPLPEPYEGETE